MRGWPWNFTSSLCSTAPLQLFRFVNIAVDTCMYALLTYFFLRTAGNYTQAISLVFKQSPITTMLTMILYVLHSYPVVQRLENTIHWISVDKASEATWWIVFFLVESLVHSLDNLSQVSFSCWQNYINLIYWYCVTSITTVVPILSCLVHKVQLLYWKRMPVKWRKGPKVKAISPFQNNTFFWTSIAQILFGSVTLLFLFCFVLFMKQAIQEEPMRFNYHF